MRLSLVIASLGRGGAERTASILASAWAEQGIKITLITFARDDVRAYALHPAIELRRLSVLSGQAKNLLQGMTRQLRCVRALRQALRNSAPDLIVSFMDVSNIVTLLAARGMTAPVIITEHTHPAFHSIGWHWGLLRRLVYHRAGALVCMTAPVLSWLQQRIKARGYVIPNPVKAAPAHARVALPADGGPRTVIAMGRLSGEKGFDLLLEAFSRIAPRHPAWRLKVLGDGPLRSQLEEQAAKLEMSSVVEFTGAIADPFPVLASADLFVCSSRFEGFGNALCEAMACGLPVISFDCPSGPQAIVRNGVDGLLVPAENVDGLALAMDRLMGNAEERAQLAARAPEVAVRFGLESVLELWRHLFADLLPEISKEGPAAMKQIR